MLTDELRETARPVLREVTEHPFWSGLRDGSLPGDALVRFVGQDTGHLLPALGRSFSRCAAAATDDPYTRRLAECAYATLESAPRLRAALTELAPVLEVEPAAPGTGPAAGTLAYCSFLHAATATSFTAGVGALLPMMWFHMEVCQDLTARCRPGSRYAPWIAAYDPGERAWPAVRDFLVMVDEIGERASAAERAEISAWFATACRYELEFVTE